MPSLPITVIVSLSWSPSSLSNLALPQPFNSMWSADNFLVSSSSLCAFVPLVRKDATEVWLLSKGISLWEFGPHGEKFPWTNHHHSQPWVAHSWTTVTARWRWLLEVPITFVKSLDTALVPMSVRHLLLSQQMSVSSWWFNSFTESQHKYTEFTASQLSYQHAEASLRFPPGSSTHSSSGAATPHEDTQMWWALAVPLQ